MTEMIQELTSEENKWNHQWAGISLGQKGGSTERKNTYGSHKTMKSLILWKSMNKRKIQLSWQTQTEDKL